MSWMFLETQCRISTGDNVVKSKQDGLKNQLALARRTRSLSPTVLKVTCIT